MTGAPDPRFGSSRRCRAAGPPCWSTASGSPGAPSGSPGRSALAGLTTDLGAAIDFARALGLVDIGDREQVRSAGAAVFVRRRDDLEVYDEVFARFWRGAAPRLPDGPQPSGTGRAGRGDEDEDDGALDAEAGAERPTTEAAHGRPADRQRRGALEGDPDVDDGPTIISERAYSAGEVDRHRQFDRMTAAELRDAERLIDLLMPEPRAAPDPPQRAPPPRPGRRPAGDVPAQPGDRRRRPRLGLATARPPAAGARRDLRHLGLDGAPRAGPPAVQPGAGGLGGPDRGVRVRDAAHPGHPAAARPRPRPGARPGRRDGHRLVGRDPDRRVVPRVQPALGPAGPAEQRGRRRRVGRLGPRRPRPRRPRDRPAPAELPPADLAQPARLGPGLPAAGRRDVGGDAVHRRLRPGRDAGQPRAARGSSCRTPRPGARRPAGPAASAARAPARRPRAPPVESVRPGGPRGRPGPGRRRRPARRPSPGRSTADGAGPKPRPAVRRTLWRMESRR